EYGSTGPTDALGLYLRQMGSIPLLTRAQELTLAKRLETTRRRYRRAVLFSWLTVSRVVEVFQRVRQGQQALDPTIDVVNSLDLTREHILARIPYNLRTLNRLLQIADRDFRVFLRTRSTTGRIRLGRALVRQLRKGITLVEEISPRTELLDGLAEELFRFVADMGEVERQ